MERFLPQAQHSVFLIQGEVTCPRPCRSVPKPAPPQTPVPLGPHERLWRAPTVSSAPHAMSQCRNRGTGVIRTAASSSSPWHFLCPLGALSWEAIPCQDGCLPAATQRPRSGCIPGYGSHSASPALREMALPGSCLPSLPVTEPACHPVLASALGHALGPCWEQDRPISAGGQPWPGPESFCLSFLIKWREFLDHPQGWL